MRSSRWFEQGQREERPDEFLAAYVLRLFHDGQARLGDLSDQIEVKQAEHLAARTRYNVVAARLAAESCIELSSPTLKLARYTLGLEDRINQRQATKTAVYALERQFRDMHQRLHTEVDTLLEGRLIQARATSFNHDGYQILTPYGPEPGMITRDIRARYLTADLETGSLLLGSPQMNVLIPLFVAGDPDTSLSMIQIF